MRKHLSTGMAVIKKNGVIIAKCDFPPNSTHTFDDDVVVEELSSRAELENTKIPLPASPFDPEEVLIFEKVIEIQRRTAISELKAEGKLPANYQDKKAKP